VLQSQLQSWVRRTPIAAGTKRQVTHPDGQHDELIALTHRFYDRDVRSLTLRTPITRKAAGASADRACGTRRAASLIAGFALFVFVVSSISGGEALGAVSGKPESSAVSDVHLDRTTLADQLAALREGGGWRKVSGTAPSTSDLGVPKCDAARTSGLDLTAHVSSPTLSYDHGLDLRLEDSLYSDATAAKRAFQSLRSTGVEACIERSIVAYAQKLYPVGTPDVMAPKSVRAGDQARAAAIVLPVTYKNQVVREYEDYVLARKGRVIVAVNTVTGSSSLGYDVKLARWIAQLGPTMRAARPVTAPDASKGRGAASGCVFADAEITGGAPDFTVCGALAVPVPQGWFDQSTGSSVTDQPPLGDASKDVPCQISARVPQQAFGSLGRLRTYLREQVVRGAGPIRSIRLPDGTALVTPWMWRPNLPTQYPTSAGAAKEYWLLHRRKVYEVMFQAAENSSCASDTTKINQQSFQSRFAAYDNRFMRRVSLSGRETLNDSWYVDYFPESLRGTEIGAGPPAHRGSITLWSLSADTHVSQWQTELYIKAPPAATLHITAVSLVLRHTAQPAIGNSSAVIPSAEYANPAGHVTKQPFAVKLGPGKKDQVEVCSTYGSGLFGKRYQYGALRVAYSIDGTRRVHTFAPVRLGGETKLPLQILAEDETSCSD
jgi:hypothetical protein